MGDLRSLIRNSVFILINVEAFQALGKKMSTFTLLKDYSGLNVEKGLEEDLDVRSEFLKLPEKERCG